MLVVADKKVPIRPFGWRFGRTSAFIPFGVPPIELGGSGQLKLALRATLPRREAECDQSPGTL
jgi:hypothetical protein